MGLLGIVWTLSFVRFALAAPHAQVPLTGERGSNDGLGEIDVSKKRPLHGRFLHVTGKAHFWVKLMGSS